MKTPTPSSWLLCAPAAVALLTLTAPDASAQRLRAQLITNEVDSPTCVAMAPGDPSRIYIVERSSGFVRVVRDGVLLPDPFIDISENLRARLDGGFLGITFHPDYQNNGYVYIYFTDANGDGVVERYTVTDNPDVADPASRFEIIKILRNPLDDLHAGGFIEFGPMDGYLYLSHGDGGPQGDPDNNAQNPGLLLGKMMRIDVDGGTPYAIPPDNPFVGEPGYREEIWAGGLRNPWQASFDSLTGDMYIGDVGYFTWEEVDFIPAGVGGLNFGWPIMEGLDCRRPPQNCDPDDRLTDPILQYRHQFIPPIRCSVSAGNVYRGSRMPLMSGFFFFADYCSGEIISIRYDGSQITDFAERTEELRRPNGGRLSQVVGFGEDLEGEMFIIDIASGVYRIMPEMEILVPDLVAGEVATVTITGAQPNASVALLYSLSGIGETPVPGLNITLALQNPQLAGITQAGPNGAAQISGTIPDLASGATLWLQAAWSENTSDVVERTVQ